MNAAPANLIGSYRIDAAFALVSAVIVLTGGILVAYVFIVRGMVPPAGIALAASLTGYSMLRTLAVNRLRSAQAGARLVARPRPAPRHALRPAQIA